MNDVRTRLPAGLVTARRCAAGGGGAPSLASRIEQLQRTVGNRAVAHLLQSTQPQRTLQRAHASVLLSVNPGWTVTNRYTSMNLQLGRQAVPFMYPMRRYVLPLGHFNGRGEAIAQERSWVRSNANNIPFVKISPAALVRPPANAEETVDVPGQGQLQVQTQTPSDYWPFMLRLQSTYGAQPVTREIDIQFSRDKYGYVTRIDDGGQVFSMSDAAVGPRLPHEYSPLHDVDAPVAPAPARDLDVRAAAFADTHDADDQTKVIAEGARWQAVGTKASWGGLTDQTRFYARRDATGALWQPNAQVPYVTLPQLWTQWNKFGKQWNVDDATLRDKLLTNAQFISGTDTFANLQGSPANKRV